MAGFPAPLKRLIDELIKLPGIGPKSAQRLMMHLLRAPEEDLLKLSDALKKLKSSIHLCACCFHLSEGKLCDICSDPTRDTSVPSHIVQSDGHRQSSDSARFDVEDAAGFEFEGPLKISL